MWTPNLKQNVMGNILGIRIFGPLQGGGFYRSYMGIMEENGSYYSGVI